MNNIKINNFKGFKNIIEIDLQESKNLLLYGENGAGKTTIFDAIKIAFFSNRIIEESVDSIIPEERVANISELWNSYNNLSNNQDFQISIDNLNHNEIVTTNYNVYMVSLDNLVIKDSINLKDVLSNFYLDIPDINIFVQDNYIDIEDIINIALLEFKESISVEINIENNFSINIIDTKRSFQRVNQLRKYFNEAKLNLIYLLVLFAAIQKSQSKESGINKIIVLDDFITSLDASNRTFLIRYVFDTFKDFQKIILTHNVSFYNLGLYLINEIYSKNTEWVFASLYEIGGVCKLFTKESLEKVENIKNAYEELPKPLNEGKIDEIGNRIRKKFEALLYELSKIIMIGAVEESKNIITKVNTSNNLYFNSNKTATDLVNEIINILNDENTSENYLILKNRIFARINLYKIENLNNLKVIINDLKLYQKVILHPMSHSSGGQTTFTTKEITQSLELLSLLEKHLSGFVDKNVDRI